MCMYMCMCMCMCMIHVHQQSGSAGARPPRASVCACLPVVCPRARKCGEKPAKKCACRIGVHNATSVKWSFTSFSSQLTWIQFCSHVFFLVTRRLGVLSGANRDEPCARARARSFLVLLRCKAALRHRRRWLLGDGKGSRHRRGIAWRQRAYREPFASLTYRRWRFVLQCRTSS